MTSEGHSGFEDGRVGPGEAEFQVGVDDSRLDEPDARFTHEKITNGKLYAHDRAGQPVDGARHFSQVHFILEIGNLNTRQCFRGLSLCSMAIGRDHCVQNTYPRIIVVADEAECIAAIDGFDVNANRCIALSDSFSVKCSRQLSLVRLVSVQSVDGT
jgi:hypothetical protein